MIIEIILILCAFPIGLLISYLARDELIIGRKWFKAIFLVSIFFSIYFYLFGERYAVFSSIFIAIVAIVSYTRSFDLKLTRKRF